MTDLQTQLKDLLQRQKALAAKKDQLVQETAREEAKLETLYEKLDELGYKNAREMSAQELGLEAEQLEKTLVDQVAQITEQIERGESLMREYQAVQE